MVKYRDAGSSTMSDVNEFASVYSSEDEDASYAEYYAKFASKSKDPYANDDYGQDQNRDDYYDDESFSSEVSSGNYKEAESMDDTSKEDSYDPSIKYEPKRSMSRQYLEQKIVVSSSKSRNASGNHRKEQQVEPTHYKKTSRSFGANSNVSRKKNIIKSDYEEPSRSFAKTDRNSRQIAPSFLRQKREEVVEEEIPSIPSVATPSIDSVETPSVEESDFEDDDDNYDEGDHSRYGNRQEPSEMDSIVSSVMSSLMKPKNQKVNRNDRNLRSRVAAQVRETRYENFNYTQGDNEYDEFDDDKIEEEPAQTDDMSYEYDNFMNNFQNKSNNIVHKQSVGLMKLQDEINVPKNRFGSNRHGDVGHEAVERGRMQSRNLNANKSKPSGFFGFMNNNARSENPAIAQRAHNHYELDNEPADVESVEFSPVSYEPPVMRPPAEVGGSSMGMGMSNQNMNEVQKYVLDLRKKANIFLVRRQYNELIPFLQANPKLVSVQYHQKNSMNFIHLLATQNKAVPENVILKILSQDPSLVSVSDELGNTPLHYATINAKKGNMHVFLVMLKFNPLGAMQRNSDGDLPLHLAACNCSSGSQMAVHMLLETNSNALTEPNNKGKIPLHYALTDGAKNLKSLKSILQVHHARKYDVVVKDNKGNTPLHAAILNNTNYPAIDLFNKIVGETELAAYTKENDQRYLPLHLALTVKTINPLTVLSLIKAAPFASGTPTPNGEMPIALATKAELKPEIIKTLLATDMPIEIGTKRGNSSMGAIVERQHGHSWWHVAVDKKNKYTDVVTSLLTDFATYVQIVALARSIGPDKKTMTIDAASPALIDAVKNMLRFYYRYEISMSSMPITTNEIQSFPALDHGEELESLKVTGPWLKSGFTKIRENPRQNVAVERNREISYVPWESEDQEVTLRCYAYEEQFNAEKLIREKRNLSSEHVEKMISTHNVSDYVNASFTSGKLLCISFERNEGTFGEIVQANEGIQEEAGWLTKCQFILKHIAESLQHLHENSLVHGRLDMNTVGQFGRRWKLLDIGGSIAMGDTMGGLLQKNVPPESLSGLTNPSNPLPEKSNHRGRSKSKVRLMKRGTSNVRGGMSIKSKAKSAKSLPPLPNNKTDGARKKFGVFVFGLKDLGLGNYGTKGRSRSRRGTGNNSTFVDTQSMDSSIASVPDGTSVTDEASARVIAMQEDEISRLRKALEEKEHIYRHQLAEERASFKRQEVERQKQLQNKRAEEASKIQLPLFAPEKVMASALWDVWSFGLIVAEAMIGKSPLLPSSATSDADFLLQLSQFTDVQLSAICEEVNEFGGQYVADLVARLLNPKPQQRITSMEMALKHKYFHETQLLPGNPNRRRFRGRGKVAAGRGRSKNPVAVMSKSESKDTIAIKSKSKNKNNNKNMKIKTPKKQSKLRRSLSRSGRRTQSQQRRSLSINKRRE